MNASNVRALLSEHGLRPSRALGQHFLADPNTARRIVGLAGIGAGDRVLEIGPGMGSLTLALAEVGADVVALELDRHLLPVLADVVGDRARVVVGDATITDLAALVDEAFPGDGGTARTVQCVSNLPYNVATTVVVRLLETVSRVEHLAVMVQREVAERMVARPGGKEYGAVSVKIAYYATGGIVGAVPRSVFVPRPNVDSALVRLTRHAVPPVDVAPGRLFELVRAGFAQRRKTLRRALAPVLGDRATTALASAGIDRDARAETLGLDEWAALVRAAP